MEWIDTHAHLDEEAFALDCDDVVKRAIEAGVAAIITIGTTASSSRRAVALAEKYPAVFAAIGIQPNYVSTVEAGDWDVIRELALHPKTVAIGETGLDRYWDYAPFELQSEYFSRHLELARERNLPFVVHCREAEADVVAQLRKAADTGPLRGIMHSFCGDQATADACLELGMHISFAGMLTFKKNDELREVSATIPLDRLLVETDAPYLSPMPRRGKRNEPANVAYTGACVAQAKGISVEEIARQTTDNARRLFGLLTPEAKPDAAENAETRP